MGSDASPLHCILFSLPGPVSFDAGITKLQRNWIIRIVDPRYFRRSDRAATGLKANMRRMRAAKTGAIAGVALCLALIGLGPATASAGTRAAGIDVSRFQRTIIWPSVAGAGIRFAFVQASRGSGADCTVKPTECGADPYFAAN